MFGFFKKKPAKEQANQQNAIEKDPVHIRIRGVHKAFGENKEHKVLRGVDLDLFRGKINIIIGGSGQGKSVLLKHVIALLEPDQGEIHVDGFNIVKKSDFELQPIRRKFGMLFQYAALFDSMTVLDNIAFPMREHTRLNEKEIKERVFERLKQLKLESAIMKFPAELSGGMKKRVALARALALNPEIIIYDEPTTGLDPVLTKEVDNLMLETAQREKVTSLVISHDMASTFRIGDYVAMLYEGKIVAAGHPRDLKDNPHPGLQEFLTVSGIDLSKVK